ncbi:DUF3710 domain-containing protein [Arcanobacterium pinnipediorum]|uniref:DUF3710 domain-containing protein n=1 Tax=Arcanobacterium pinnipediorum TaxID=1503041 RepID=A0ABY5AK25_9ACTO|nr:DUF3710 domain-containing protein [Arcanobacterium pinnipediorum]USR80126.1 DUF3710 domain-containing protein [Arcanobacterium pinnipediorum]
MGWFSRKAKESMDVDSTDDLDKSTSLTGPFDYADHPEQGDLLDAGALWIPYIPEAKIQFSVDQQEKNVFGVVYVIDDSAMQLQVFAAPRSSGLWDDVRRDMITSIAQQGGSSSEVDGVFGKELHAQVPVAQSEHLMPHRFLGVDGPRWLLRITLYGRAGSDDVKASQLLDIAHQVVVVRGNTPYPPRELLELRVPRTNRDREE